MAKKLYEEANIQAIADAIREKNGLSEAYRTSDMAQAILDLSAGSGENTGGVLFPPADNWKTTKLSFASSYSLGSCSFSDGVFTGSASTYQGAGMVSPLTDFSGLNTLHISFSASGTVDSYKWQFVVYVSSTRDNDGAVVDKVASSGEIAAGAMDIDVSAVSGSYYLMAGVMVWGNGANASCIISNVRLE